MYEEEFVVSLWAIAFLVLWVLKLKWSNRRLRRKLALAEAPPVPVAANAPAPLHFEGRSQERDEEMERLLNRVAVLERITVDKESTLSREIDSLRYR